MTTAIRSLGFVALVSGLALTLGLGPQEKKVTSPSSNIADAAPQEKSAGGAESFVVDGVHSSNVFKVRHNGVANFYGRFNDMSGSVVWNAADPAAGSINVEVKTDSIDTNGEGRDKHLKSADFFDAEKFATFGFKSNAIKKTGENTYDVTGDLTLHGVTKSITVKFDHAGPVDTRQGRRIGLETTFTVKRSEYGMTKFLEGNGIGDEVTMTVSMECVVPRKREGQ